MNNEAKVRRYSAEIEFLEGEGFVASYKELGRSAMGHGHTPAEALADLELAVADLVAALDEDFPDPIAPRPWSEYSGRLTVRLPRELHWQLDELAEDQRVSLNSLISDLLRKEVSAYRQAPAAGQKTSAPAVKRVAQRKPGYGR